MKRSTANLQAPTNLNQICIETYQHTNQISPNQTRLLYSTVGLPLQSDSGPRMGTQITEQLSCLKKEYRTEPARGS